MCLDYLNNQNFENVLAKNRSNVSKTEWETIKSLKENYSTVIEEADKGRIVVVINKIRYYSIILKILQDKMIYKKQTKIMTKKF